MINKKYNTKVLITNEFTINDLQTKLFKIATKHNIIGYHIQNKKEHFGQMTEKLQLFYIKDEQGHLDIIADILDDMLLIRTGTSYKYKNVPLENWIYSHLNWLNKETYKYAKQFNMQFDDVYSEINEVLLCAVEKNIYLSNVIYLDKMIKNQLRENYDKNKDRKQVILPLDLEIDEDLTLKDAIPSDEPELGSQLEYELLQRAAKSLLHNAFSDREIKQILDGNVNSNIDLNLYRRLKVWRDFHKTIDLYEEMEKVR